MAERFLRTDEVQRRVGLGRSTIFEYERRGEFPARRKLGPKAVGWLESEIDDYLRSLPAVDADPPAS
jgi:prophage regulatory protein